MIQNGLQLQSKDAKQTRKELITLAILKRVVPVNLMRDSLDSDGT